MPKNILALDFGGTKLTAATVDLRTLDAAHPTWLNHQRFFSLPEADAQDDIDSIIRLGRELLQGQRPAAVGVSFGGPAVFNTGTIVRSDHVPGWEQVPLQNILESVFDAPVRVDNDGNVGALGELHFGAGRGCQDMFYITVSTGVGGGWIINGSPLRGHTQMAGEIGHVVIEPQGPKCLCGKRGCVERYASGPFMAQDAQHLLDRHPERGAILRQLLAEEGEATVVTGKHVAQAAALGDDIAGEILRRGAWAVGLGIGNTANLFNPERFILGGGVTKSGSLWWEGVHRAARATALPDIELNIVPAALVDDAPLWGAVALVADFVA